MTTVNKRAGKLRSVVINGIDVGGAMQAQINAGYDDKLQSPADGLEIPLLDRLTEFVRGSITSQDWAHIVDLLTGTLGTYVFYERKSGVVAATGYHKHQLTNPVLHRASINLSHRGYGVLNADFECKAADETKGIEDIWAMTDSQAAPTYVAAIRSLEITACTHNSVAIHHVTGFSFSLAMELSKASHDGDVGYTAVDAELGGIPPSGTLRFQDSGITSNKLVAEALLKAAKATLVVTVKQSQGATAKTITIANVIFDTLDTSPAAGTPYTEYSLSFRVANDATTQLTLTGTNKIITIA